MLEKRKAIRFWVGETANIAFMRDDGEFVAPLVDLSSCGLMAALPEGECSQFLPGREICGQLRRVAGAVAWRGRVVHRSPGRHGNGINIGIAFSRCTTETETAVKEIVQHPDAGGLHLQGNGPDMALEVVGRLSFSTGRESLAYLRSNAITHIDLGRCRSIDSAGLGMLCIARDRGIAISGAQGEVKGLIDIVGLGENRRSLRPPMSRLPLRPR